MNTIPSFYQALFTELQKELDTAIVSDCILPPLQQEDIVRGKLAEDLQRILTVCLRHKQVIEDMSAAADDSFVSYDTPSMHQIHAHYHRCNILDAMFWDGLRATYGSEYENLTIRAGWLVVTSTSTLPQIFTMTTSEYLPKVIVQLYDTREEEDEILLTTPPTYQ
jgi:hypothetical protein